MGLLIIHVNHQLLKNLVGLYNMPIYGKAQWNLLQDSKICKLQRKIDAIVEDKHYTHIQATASANWVINHELDKIPSILIIDDAGNEISGCVKFDIGSPLDILRIEFSEPVTGKIYLN